MPGRRPSRIEIVRRERLYDGFVTLDLLEVRHELFAGGMSAPLRREVLGQRRAVAVLPWDPRTDRVVLVEQFRAGLVDEGPGAWSLEAVAGLLDAGEASEAAAVREVREETGLEVAHLAAAGSYHSSPGVTTERVSCFVAEVTAPGGGGLHGLAAEHEDIRAHVMPRAEAVACLEDGRITVANTVVPLQWLCLNHERLRQAWLEEAGADG